MDIRLIAVDLDGTALNSKKEISPRTLAAIRSAVKSGRIIVPATGRSLNSMPKELLELHGLPYLILNNGTVVMSMPGKEVIFSHAFKEDMALSLLEQFKTFHCMMLAARPERGMLDQSIYGIKDERLQNRFMEIKRNWNPVIMDLDKAIRDDPSWVNFFTAVFSDEGEWQRMLELLKNREELSIACSAWGCIDIMPSGIHKGSALYFVAEKLSLEMSQVMAIGDHLNDLEMIRNAGYSVAMGNSVDTIKEIADRITLSCDEDGAALAIEAIL